MDEQDTTQRLTATLLAPPPPAAESVARGRARLLAEAAGSPAGTAGSAGRRPRGWVARRPALVAAAVGVAAAVTAAGTLIALHPTQGHRPGPEAAMTSGPAVAMTPALRRAILTAFDAASGDILRANWSVKYPQGTQTTITWEWPALPRPGQSAQWRYTELGVADEAVAGTFAQQGQKGQSCVPNFSLPRGAAPASVTVVDYLQRTWSHGFLNKPITPSWESPGCLRNYIALGTVFHVRRGTWHGQAALQLVPIMGDTRGRLRKLNSYTLWLSERTYLPLAARFAELLGSTGPAEEDFQLLSPTSAHLDQLKVHIPAGFRRVPPDPQRSLEQPILSD